MFGGSDQDDTWSYGPIVAAQFAPHYVSCPSSAGVPVLDGTLPWLGGTFTVGIAPVPVNTAAVLALGMSATALFGVIPLPLDLRPLGMPGCWWYTDIAVTLPMAVTTGTARVSIGLPAAAHLAGVPFCCQGLVLDPPANPLGLVSTNAGAAVLGAK